MERVSWPEAELRVRNASLSVPRRIPASLPVHMRISFRFNQLSFADIVRRYDAILVIFRFNGYKYPQCSLVQ